MLPGRRPLTAAELAARRRNAQKSTGPRTPEGKRRSALNSLKKYLCPHWRAFLIPLKGQDPREYRRLHRDLIALLQPDNSFFRSLVRDLAEAWWEKLCWLRGQTSGPTGWPTAHKLDQRIESRLMTYVTALSLHWKKWNARLANALGGPVSSPAMMRETVEARLAAFRTHSGIIQVVNGQKGLVTAKKNSFPKNAKSVTHRRDRDLAEPVEKTNLPPISPALPMG